MIRYFVTPKPDECLYSIIARFILHTLSDNPKVINRILFGDEYVSASIDLPGHLSLFHKNVESLFPYTIDQIIKYFTLYPFYFPFLRNEKRELIYNSMLSLDASTIHTRAGINASSIKRSRFPKYCPICLIEDSKNFGDIYFHRVHQIPEIRICTKHNCYLIELTPRFDQLNTSLYLGPNLIIDKSIRTVDNSLLTSIAREFEGIHFGNNVIDVNTLDYANEKCLKNYFKQGRINRIKLAEDFEKHFKSENLVLLFGNDAKRLWWVSDIVKRPEHVFHPLKHVLVKIFIESYSLLFIPKQDHPFGKGPWKCINKVSEHFLKDVITEVEFHIDKKSKRVIGTFTCSCGMVYTKSFVNKKGEGKREFVRIKEWGNSWKERLEMELVSGKGLREISRIMGADTNVIKGFKETFEKDDCENELMPTNLEEYKNKWIALLEKYSNARIKKARKEAPWLYVWLYRNAKQWLLDINRKYQVKTNTAQLRLNWHELDEEIVSQLEAITQKFKDSDYPAQLTRTFLAKAIKKDQYLLGKSIKKLPKSNLFLNNSIEKLEEYQKRRVARIIQEFKRKGDLLAKWKIIRVAGLKKPLIPSIDNFITESIKNQIG
ncbi:MAG: TnsD family transposase [Chitinophagaceae bacterium]|nr:TnsD family transposase [Chitinophagaceae bacterium]